MYPKILPFKGVMYNQAKVAHLSQVVTPPYDVINPEMQKAFYDRSPYNFVRVDLAKEPGRGRYEAAKKDFTKWMEEGILVQDEKPAFYFHHQTFTLPSGVQVTRKGFFGVRRIEDFSEGGIKPHEKTLEGPKADRLELTRAVHAQLSPVFSLYLDAEKKIDHLVRKLKDNPPTMDFTTAEGERHQLWKETDPTVCKFVESILAKQPLFIADGHHRYETSLNYRNEMRAECPTATGVEPFNYVLMYFSNMADEGLVILPIHRALHHLKNFDKAAFLRQISQYFRVRKLETRDAKEISALLQSEQNNHAFVMMTRNPIECYLLSMSEKTWRDNIVSTTVPEALRDLDVTVLHRLIFEEILRITPAAQANQENIIYWKDTQKAISETETGACDMTFLLNPTKIQSMEKVAMAGEKMPQKSTYFYPKILSGLVLHPV